MTLTLPLAGLLDAVEATRPIYKRASSYDELAAAMDQGLSERDATMLTRQQAGLDPHTGKNYSRQQYKTQYNMMKNMRALEAKARSGVALTESERAYLNMYKMNRAILQRSDPHLLRDIEAELTAPKAITPAVRPAGQLRQLEFNFGNEPQLRQGELNLGTLDTTPPATAAEVAAQNAVKAPAMPTPDNPRPITAPKPPAPTTGPAPAAAPPPAATTAANKAVNRKATTGEPPTKPVGKQKLVQGELNLGQLDERPVTNAVAGAAKGTAAAEREAAAGERAAARLLPRLRGRGRIAALLGAAALAGGALGAGGTALFSGGNKRRDDIEYGY